MSFSKRLAKALAFTVVAALLCCEAGYVLGIAEPAYAAKKKSSKKKTSKKKNTSKQQQKQGHSLINKAKNNYWASDYPASVGYRPVGQQLEKVFRNVSWRLESDNNGNPVAMFQGIGNYDGRKAMYKVEFRPNPHNNNVYINSIKVNDRTMYDSTGAGLNTLSNLFGYNRPGTHSLWANDQSFFEAFLRMIYRGE